MDNWSEKLQRSRYLRKLAFVFGALGMFLIVASYAPSFWFYLTSSFGKGVSRNSEQILSTANTVGGRGFGEERVYQPRLDASLPKKNMLIIPSIGVETVINEAEIENYEDALKKGVWRVGDSGTPKTRTKPIVLVAHRFGYLKWTNLFRRKNSFYNLPKLSEGEVVEVVWRQRKYKYAIYKADEGTEITDYGADLILYTCLDLSSDIRIFRYGRLLEI